MSDDSFEDLEMALALERSGIHRVVNSGTGAVGFFPSVPHHPAGSAAQRELEDDWEARSIAMHSAQRTVIPEPKPESSSLRDRRVTRGD